MTTLTYTGRLTVTTCWCGIPHAVPEEMFDAALRAHNDGRDYTSIHCPLGHKWRFAATPQVDHERKAAERARIREQQVRDQLLAAERSAIAYKGHATRLRKRAAAGVCPCCSRSFQNLKRHMDGQHPGFGETP